MADSGTEIPRAKKGLVCPLHQKDMNTVCHKCPWWTLLRGKDPQTAEEVDKWGCSIAFLPMLTIENSKETRQAAAAIESFRNEMVKANEMTHWILKNENNLKNISDEKPMKIVHSKEDK